MGVIQDIHDDLERGATQLVAEYRERLCRDALALCGDEAEAEDFAFRAFDKAIRHIDSFKGEASFYGWMKSILANDISSARRTKAAQNTTVAEADPELPAPEGATGTPERLMAEFDAEVVRQAIGTLSEEQRETILLHYFLDQPVGKMAKLLAIPEGTVKFRLYAARKALAAILSKQMKRPIVRMALLVLLGAGALYAGLNPRFRAFFAGGDADEPRPAATLDGAEPVQPEQAKDIFDNKEGENMIMTRKVASLVGASLLAVATPGEEITSEPTFVFLRPETSSFWNTATNSTMTLPIDYPRGATKATLTVSGAGYAEKTYPNITGASFDLELPVPDSPQNENVYDLTLTFDDGTVRTAKLGLIQGLSPDSEGSTRCLAPAEGDVWNTIKKRAVLPIPYGTESFTMSVNGGTVTDVNTGLNGAQGWYALKPTNGDSVSLSLVAGGINYAATLLGKCDGYFVIIR